MLNIMNANDLQSEDNTGSLHGREASELVLQNDAPAYKRISGLRHGCPMHIAHSCKLKAVLERITPGFCGIMSYAQQHHSRIIAEASRIQHEVHLASFQGSLCLLLRLIRSCFWQLH